MQLLALNGSKKIWPYEANQGQEYTCPDCGYPVKLRWGIVRRPHFYHVYESPKCKKLSTKLHRSIQYYIYRLLHFQTVEIEKSYPEIDRIADIFWAEKKIIFEVQCTMIPFKEMQDRVRDYASLGLQVVWLLHANNPWLTSATWDDLKKLPHFYTNLDLRDNGVFFDQIWLEGHGKSAPYVVELDAPLPMRHFPMPVPDLLIERTRNRRYYFQGDYLHFWTKHPYMIPKREPRRKNWYVKWIDNLIKKHNF
ncbi:MAG: hypothetical protein MRY21_00715 [Simkaniaceae bacterium]|nr:hypothetical protein [Simkaniaceae bacterium]